MRSDDEIDASPPSFTPCSAVRITPYADGAADHDQAVTYRFEKPITFAYVHRTRLPPIGASLRRYDSPMPGLVGFTAPYDHEENGTVCAVAQGLWQRRGTEVAVELWSHGHDWRYMLIPRWRRLDIDEQQFIAGPPGHRTHSAGEALAVDQGTVWPRLDPALGEYDVEWGTQLLITSDMGPPPPAGFPAPAAGHRTHA